MIEVKIIQQRGQSVLVEWVDGRLLRRATIPADVIVEGRVGADILEMGIPYGVDWSKLIELDATPKKLDQRLKQVGIWTAEDALKNADRLLGAIQAAYSVDLGKIMSIARHELDKKE